MKKLLFVDCCIRGKESRTKKLAKSYINALKDSYEVSYIDVANADIAPFDLRELKERESNPLVEDDEKFLLAKEFASADLIVMAAPFWDCSFPAKMKTYIEHISVNGITFAYNPDGSLKKLCKAERLVYITTCGGFLNKPSAVEMFIKEYAAMLCIDDVRFYAAEGLDIYPDRVDDELREELNTIIKEI